LVLYKIYSVLVFHHNSYICLPGVADGDRTRVKAFTALYLNHSVTATIFHKNNSCG
jgi:hypothetical protein